MDSDRMRRESLALRVWLGAIRGAAYQENEKLQELSSFVESALLDMKEHIVSRAVREIDRTEDEDAKQFLAECYGEEVLDVEKVYPQVQRRALFTMVMSQLEVHLKALCKLAKRFLNLETGFNESKHPVIVNAVRYLKEEAGIDTTRIKYYTSLADELRYVRNCIVHAEGRISKANNCKAVRAFVQRIPTIESDESETLVLKSGFVEIFAHEMYTLMDRLYNLVSKRIRSHIRSFT